MTGGQPSPQISSIPKDAQRFSALNASRSLAKIGKEGRLSKISEPKYPFKSTDEHETDEEGEIEENENSNEEKKSEEQNTEMLDADDEEDDEEDEEYANYKELRAQRAAASLLKIRGKQEGKRRGSTSASPRNSKTLAKSAIKRGAIGIINLLAGAFDLGTAGVTL